MVDLRPYNLKRHVELLKLKQKVLNEKKSFKDEYPEEAAELLDYNVHVEQHVEWTMRFETAEVVTDFLRKEINTYEFCTNVYGLRRTLLERSKIILSKLISEGMDFNPNENAYKISRFISALFFMCQDLDNKDYDEAEFYTIIENGFLEFQRILNEDI